MKLFIQHYLNKIPLHLLFAERIGCLFGWLATIFLWFYSTMYRANADLPPASADPHVQLATITTAMLLATIIGTLGSYLAFGEDKKFPPTAASIGHILLGFGAGLFFTRGSLELMGRLDSSENIVLFVSFLWAVVGYFALRLGVAVISSPQIQAIMPDWVIRLVGARLPPAQDNVPVTAPVADTVSEPVANTVSEPITETVKGQDTSQDRPLVKKHPNRLLPKLPHQSPPQLRQSPHKLYQRLPHQSLQEINHDLYP